MAQQILQLQIRDGISENLMSKTTSAIVLQGLDYYEETLNTLKTCIYNGDINDVVEKLSELGEKYSTLYQLANTVKEFLESVDVADETINTWEEIENFLKGITDSESLTGLLNDLKTTLESEISDVQKDLQDNIDCVSDNLDSEIERATTKESDLEDLIDNEESRAKKAEEILQTNIDNLEQRIINIESNIIYYNNI